MNKKYLYKALCLLSALIVHQTNAATLLNPGGPGYNVVDNCPGCWAVTDIEVLITNNAHIELEFDPLGFSHEDINIVLVNNTGAAWSNLTIEYNNFDPFLPMGLGLSVLNTGGSIPTIDSVLINPNTGDPSGLALSFLPAETDMVHIGGFADRLVDTWSPYIITIDTTAVPVPAAIWLFGSGLIGLIGVARRNKS